MRQVTHCALVSLLAMLAGCAPDAWKASGPFDSWLSSVRSACNYQTIGRYEVGSLLGMNVSDEATIFVDQTSRLYAGTISPDQWTLTVASALYGRASDPGIGCVLGQLTRK